MSQALALKYRPSRFEDLIGQEAVSQTLALALDTKRLSHAYLFSGLRGSGKTSSARIFAKALNCSEGPTSVPCDSCENCAAAKAGNHLDITEMDAASSRKIDDIRYLIEQTKYRPSMGRFKIFIIDEVHMLTKEAFNALLKTLEEPPPYVKFILATTDPLKLPATILSRTQHFRFKKIAHREVVAHLQKILHLEEVAFESEALEMIARSGNGSLRDTLTLLDQAIIFSKGTLTPTLVAQMLGLVDPLFLEQLLEAILADDQEKLNAFLKELESYEAEMILGEMSIFLQEKLTAQDPRYPLAFLDRCFRIISDSHQLLSIGSHNAFVLTLTLLKMREALKIKEIDSMIEALEKELLAPTPHAHTPQPIHQQSTPSPLPSAPSLTPPSSGAILFDHLKAKIYDRSYDLGECFEKHISFVSFADSTLSWSSSATGACRERLKEAYGIIKHFVKEIYGLETTIKQAQAPAPSEDSPDPKPTQEEKHENTPEPTPPPSAEEDPSNLGCVGSLVDEGQENTKNAEEILKAPLVETIKEQLGVKKVIVRNKL